MFDISWVEVFLVKILIFFFYYYFVNYSNVYFLLIILFYSIILLLNICSISILLIFLLFGLYEICCQQLSFAIGCLDQDMKSSILTGKIHCNIYKYLE